MIDPDHIPPVAADELLTRFVLQRSQFRPSDETVKPDAFIPHPHQNLSVTRHRDASQDKVWQVGLSIAAAQSRTLYGRADIAASVCQSTGLLVESKPIPENPNHAEISGWPSLKEDQKAIAIDLAAAASFVRHKIEE